MPIFSDGWFTRGMARPLASFQCGFVRELPDNQFAFVVQWIYMTGDDFTIDEEVQFTGPSPQAVLLPFMCNQWKMPVPPRDRE
jgi:hypothetical protein